MMASESFLRKRKKPIPFLGEIVMVLPALQSFSNIFSIKNKERGEGMHSYLEKSKIHAYMLHSYFP